MSKTRDLCKFDMGLSVVCIREYETLKVDRHYRINGMGDLTMNNATDKHGYGFCILDEFGTWVNNRTSTKTLSKNYYFTEKEMYQYFITEEENHQIFIREQKLNTILNG